MQCANCDFYNMPGSAVCGRCGTSLQLKSAAVSVMPPRASPVAKRLRRALPVRRVYYRMRDRLPTERAVAAVTRAAPLRPLLVRMIVPGWTHLYLEQPVRAHLFLWGWLFCLLVSVLTSAGWSAFWFGLAFSVHSSAAADVLTQNFADIGLRDRILRGLGVSAALWALVYWPATHAIGRVAQPQTIETNMPPFDAGDVVLINHLATAAVGQIVMFPVPDSPFTIPPELAHYHRFIHYAGDAIDRILAGPGDRVELTAGHLYINGRPARWLPLNPLAVKGPIRFVLTPDHFLIVPSGAPDIQARLGNDAETWKRLCSVAALDIDGRLLLRLHPLSRFGFVH